MHRDLYLKTKGNCWFNHIIELSKNNKSEENPLFDYQQTVYEALEKHKFLWILKATGFGIIEFFLRYMVWLVLRNNDYKNSQFIIVTNPNWDFSKK